MGTNNAQKPMNKSLMVKTLSESCELKPKQVRAVLADIAELAAAEVKRIAKFTIPRVAMIKTKVKPATKAGVRVMFGKEVACAAKPAKTVVKAYTASALKKSI